MRRMRGYRAIVTFATFGLLASAFAGDQYARRQAEQQVAGMIVTSFDGICGRPGVSVQGWPFAVQRAVGRLEHVTARADRATVGDLLIDDVVLDARGATLDDPMVVEQASVSATVTAEAAQTYLREHLGLTDLEIRVEEDRVVVGTRAFDQPVVVGGGMTVDGTALRLDLEALTLGGVTLGTDLLPATIRDQLDSLRVPLAGLPHGLRLTDAQTVHDGVRFTATGTDVTLGGAE